MTGVSLLKMFVLPVTFLCSAVQSIQGRPCDFSTPGCMLVYPIQRFCQVLEHKAKKATEVLLRASVILLKNMLFMLFFSVILQYGTSAARQSLP